MYNICMRPRIYTVPQMIDLIIRLLIEKLMVKQEYWGNEAKKRDLNEAIIILKDLKANLDPEYKEDKPKD